MILHGASAWTSRTAVEMRKELFIKSLILRGVTSKEREKERKGITETEKKYRFACPLVLVIISDFLTGRNMSDV